MQRRAGFTLLEIVIAVFILLLLMGLAVPSVNGVFADKRLHRSLDQLNGLVRDAHERSVGERRAYLIVLGKDSIDLRPAAFLKTEAQKATDSMPISPDDKWTMHFPAALSKGPPSQWIFWESGVCEPARIDFSGSDGKWSVEYSPLSAIPEITAYAPR